jgi:hypothetical protein
MGALRADGSDPCHFVALNGAHVLNRWQSKKNRPVRTIRGNPEEFSQLWAYIEDEFQKIAPSSA